MPGYSPLLGGDRTKAMSGDAVRHLFQRMATKAGLPTGQRYGWHSLRRKFGNELRHLPLNDLCDLGGWKNAATILTCYRQPSEQAQREGLEQRREVRIGAVSEASDTPNRHPQASDWEKKTPPGA